MRIGSADRVTNSGITSPKKIKSDKMPRSKCVMYIAHCTTKIRCHGSMAGIMSILFILALAASQRGLNTSDSLCQRFLWHPCKAEPEETGLCIVAVPAG
jgi:hypothetical protein